MRLETVRPQLLLAICVLMLAGCATRPPSETAVPVTRTVSGAAATASLQAPSATPTRLAQATEPATAAAAPTLTPSPTDSPTAPPSSATIPPVVRLMAVGDLMLARGVGDRLRAKGPGVVFAGVSTILSRADLLVANLECVISDQGSPQPKSYTFRAPPLAVQALAQARFNVVGLANNHTLDYGTAALADMLPRLRESGIAYVGAGADAQAARAPVVLDRHGVRIAFLSYVNVPVEGRTAFDTRSWAAGIETPGVAWADPAVITQDVTQARTLADIVVVLLHVGLEGHSDVSTLQQTLAHTAVDAGATLVLGTHSHVLQPVEHYKGGLIAYSLGNFVFDGFLAPANYTAIFSATLTPRGITSFEWVPVLIEHGLPRLATSEEAALILPRVQ